MRLGGSVGCFWTGVRMRCVFPRLNSYNLTMQSQQMKKKDEWTDTFTQRSCGQGRFCSADPFLLGKVRGFIVFS